MKTANKEWYTKVYYRLASDCDCDRESDRFKTFGCECDPDGERDRVRFLTSTEPLELHQITEMIADHHCVPPSEVWVSLKQTLDHKWLNVYKVDRAYGGPEEGGWYYDYGFPELSIPLIPSILEHLTEIKAELAVTYSNEGRRPISSVLSQGEYRIVEEYEAAKPWPSETPHYE